MKYPALLAAAAGIACSIGVATMAAADQPPTVHHATDCEGEFVVDIDPAGDPNAFQVSQHDGPGEFSGYFAAPGLLWAEVKAGPDHFRIDNSTGPVEFAHAISHIDWCYPGTVDTTEPPVETTEPVVTTTPPVETTEPPTETTEPVDTTEPPTTEEPTSTTGPTTIPSTDAPTTTTTASTLPPVSSSPSTTEPSTPTTLGPTTTGPVTPTTLPPSLPSTVPPPTSSVPTPSTGPTPSSPPNSPTTTPTAVVVIPTTVPTDGFLPNTGNDGAYTIVAIGALLAIGGTLAWLIGRRPKNPIT